MILPIALTCGDPNGIGIDLTFEAFKRLNGSIPFFLIADASHLLSRSNKEPFLIIENSLECFEIDKGILPVLHHRFPEMPSLKGSQPENALATIQVIERAVNMVQSKEVSAICTNPINKKVLKDGANFAYPGHTEFLAHLSDQKASVMMLLSDKLRVVPVTIHIALNKVSSMLSQELLINTIKTTHRALCKDFGIDKPRISVAGLNPHAGEDGTFGNEENNIIIPVLNKLRTEGMNILGPMSADTMFHEQARKNYDVAICMYHDQALIPLKAIDFYGGVNTTLGLPFIRTSPDHGTAFEFAGTRNANPNSLINALKIAYKMAKIREK